MEHRAISTLAGAEGFEPPSPVLETGSLTVELTPLHENPLQALAIAILSHRQGSGADCRSLISFPYVTCASGKCYRTCSAQCAPWSSSCSWWSNSSGSYNRCTVM